MTDGFGVLDGYKWLYGYIFIYNYIYICNYFGQSLIIYSNYSRLESLVTGRVLDDYIPLCSGWWFRTFVFFHILGIIIPIDFHIFQRG